MAGSRPGKVGTCEIRLSSQDRGNGPVSVQPWVALCVSECISV